ncbi:hypothetical protein IQ06DRAFT_235039 [Phaeosphaeriaceae sp. SRC1lsM3a]|nr:hypothetical protein IQ06DRAFT_235039 [Stagonospora sp. SRC1lsM3a]
MYHFPVDHSYDSPLEHAVPLECSHDASSSDAEANIINEVADWLQSQQFDDFWIPRDNHLRKVPRYITALRLHSQHRFEPAAGHHARACSETDAWPSLYKGQSLEEQVVEKVSWQRQENNKKQCAPRSMRNVWIDGTSLLRKHRTRAGSHSTVDSDSSSDVGFLSRLICQVSTPKNPKRRHNTLFANFPSRRNKNKDTLDTPTGSAKSRRTRLKPFHNLSSHAVQRIPSALRLRRTQSAPRNLEEDTKPVRPSYGPKRHSSNPSIGSPLNYPFEIPQIRRTSATPGEIHGEGHFDSVRLCGRGDLITAKEYNEEREANHVLHSEEHSRHTISLPAQIPEIASSSTTAISNATSSNATTIISGQPKYKGDYFASVHAATHVHDAKDDDIDPADDLKVEREDAGPSIDECPMLQKMFARMEASGEDDSSESDMETCRKRKSILGGANDLEHCIVERFKPREYNDSCREDK